MEETLKMYSSSIKVVQGFKNIKIEYNNESTKYLLILEYSDNFIIQPIQLGSDQDLSKTYFDDAETFFKCQKHNEMVNDDTKKKVFDKFSESGILQVTFGKEQGLRTSLSLPEQISNRFKASYLVGTGLIHLIDIHSLTEYLGTLEEVLAYLKSETGSHNINIQGLSDADLERFKNIESDSPITVEDETVEETVEEPIKYEKLSNVEINWPTGVNPEDIIKILRFKKAILLQGPPGTGKTKMGEAIGYKFLGPEMYDIYHFREVQFSSEFSYSDFIDGLRPNKETGNWELQPGVFRQICEDAEQLPNEKFILFIDEINRADTESVIGEMLNLMEKRDRTIKTKNGSSLKMPSNLYILATMNTIDRGAGALDMATISRFAEIDIKAADVDGLAILNARQERKFDDALIESLDDLLKIIKDINESIENDTTVELNPEGLQLGLRGLYTEYENVSELILAVKYDLIPELKSRAQKLSEKTIKDGEEKLKNWIEMQEQKEQDDK